MTSDNPNPLLIARLSGEELFRFERKEPADQQIKVRLLTKDPALELIDSAGKSRVYDLTSAVAEGMEVALFTVSVGPTFALEADCVLGESKVPSEKDLLNGKGRGIRFQPFYLPECEGDPKELVGRGLFFRGLHFSGTITASYVSALCICDACAKSFRLQSFHAGFGGNAYFYCNQKPHTLMISEYEEGAPPALGPPQDLEALARLEAKLPACAQCGGSFAYWNPLRCPHCLAPFIDFPNHKEDRYSEYYGNYLYGGEPQSWSSQPPD